MSFSFEKAPAAPVSLPPCPGSITSVKALFAAIIETANNDVIMKKKNLFFSIFIFFILQN